MTEPSERKCTENSGMIDITDDNIARAARELTANPSCRVLHQRHDISSICGASLHYAGGKVEIRKPCSEPCDFVCITARDFAKNVGIVRSVIRALKSGVLG